MGPRSAGVGQRRFGKDSERLTNNSGGLSPVRGREAPCTPSANLPPSDRADKFRSRGFAFLRIHDAHLQWRIQNLNLDTARKQFANLTKLMEPKTATTNTEESLDRATLLNRTNELANEFLDGVAQRPVAHRVDFETLLSKMRGDGLSVDAGNPLRIVEELAALADEAVVATAGPRYFGFVV